MLEVITDGFRITAIFLLVVFFLLIGRFEKTSFKKYLLLFFLSTTLAYLVTYWELIWSFNPLFQISFFLSVLFPLSFWLVSKALFDDEFIWQPNYLVYVIAISLVHYVLYRLNDIFYEGAYANFTFLPYLISTLFILMVLYEALRDRINDLVISRIKKRHIFVIFSSFIALASVYYFFTEDPWKLPLHFQLVQNIFICLFIILFFGDQFSYNSLFTPVSPKSLSKRLEKDHILQQRIIDNLKKVIEQEQVYKSEGLTITQLAEELNEKEYLVRRAINNELGYTNFNSFLNFYRIKSACTLISEIKTTKKTFQEIAYEMGFQSIATFNRAFKKETGKTPSEYMESHKS